MKQFFFFLFIFNTNLFSQTIVTKNVHHLVNYENCPESSSNEFIVKTLEDFNNKKSLYELNQKIINNKLKEKYYLNNLKISYSPIKNTLHYFLHCPKALAKVQVYNEKNSLKFSAIFTDENDYFDPNFENDLLSNNLIKSALPNLIMSNENIELAEKINLNEIIKKLSTYKNKSIVEMIYDKNKNLTVILLNQDITSSIFLGNGMWLEKELKLRSVLDYLDRENKIPNKINIENINKVILKF